MKLPITIKTFHNRLSEIGSTINKGLSYSIFQGNNQSFKVKSKLLMTFKKMNYYQLTDFCILKNNKEYNQR